MSTSVIVLAGKFTTPIATTETCVEFKILKNFAAVANFTSYGRKYSFTMDRWSRTQKDVKNATKSFNKFAQLFLERFDNLSDLFGRLNPQTNGVEASEMQKVKMVQYAILDVFTAVEQIIVLYQREVISYALFYRENPGNIDKYEKYIHIVACHCLTHSDYLGPLVQYQSVDFYSVTTRFKRMDFEKMEISINKLTDEGIANDEHDSSDENPESGSM